MTAEFRAEWLASRPWLPAPAGRRSRPCSRTCPRAGPRQRDGRAPHVIGLFGYSYEGGHASLVLDALRDLLRGGHRRCELRTARRSRAQSRRRPRRGCEAARTRGVTARSSFSGTSRLRPSRTRSPRARCCCSRTPPVRRRARARWPRRSRPAGRWWRSTAPPLAGAGRRRRRCVVVPGDAGALADALGASARRRSTARDARRARPRVRSSGGWARAHSRRP